VTWVFLDNTSISLLSRSDPALWSQDDRWAGLLAEIARSHPVIAAVDAPRATGAQRGRGLAAQPYPAPASPASP
jgi:hypothetical protein